MGCKLVVVSRSFLTQMFRAGTRHYEVVENGLPADTSIVGVYDQLFLQTDGIAFKVRSEAWPDTPANIQLEIIDIRAREIQGGPASRAKRNTYEQWANGGGPDECEHGIAAGLRCHECT